MATGVPYSGARLAIIPVLLLFLWAATEAESVVLTPWALPYLIALDLAILLGTAVGFLPVAARMTHVVRDPAGSGSYRVSFSLAALFVVAFVVRFAAAVVLFPSSLEFGQPVGGYPPMSQQLALVGVDALFSFSVGLLVARSFGIWRKWTATGASATPPNPP